MKTFETINKELINIDYIMVIGPVTKNEDKKWFYQLILRENIRLNSLFNKQSDANENRNKLLELINGG